MASHRPSPSTSSPTCRLHPSLASASSRKPVARLHSLHRNVNYNDRIILRGDKDPTTDLWTPSLGSASMTAFPRPSEYPSAPHVIADAHAAKPLQVASFAHTVRTKANSICFAHQSFCSPAIPTLLKAIKCGYLKGCPNLTTIGVTKYLNPSPATTKGHMKRPRHGIRSTRRVVPGFFPLASDGSEAWTIKQIQ